jgi:putative ABC transport system substrate-binding protein
VALTTGLQIHVLRASIDREIDAAFDLIAQLHIAALSVASDPFFDTPRTKLIALAARHAVPTMYQFREYAMAGGLMSYGIKLPGVYRRVGVYAARILKGAKPTDLPVQQPTRFEFVINLKAARLSGLSSRTTYYRLPTR